MPKPAAEWVPLDKLTPWAANPRRNDHAVEKVAASIDRFGFASPIIARPSGEVIAGHTRLKAAQHLGLDSVPVRYLDLTDTEARALAIADNRLGELAEWDDEGLAEVMRSIQADGGDLGDLGWDDTDLATLVDSGEPAPLYEYTNKIVSPIYEPKGDAPAISDLYDDSKSQGLILDIEAANLNDEVSAFLKHAAYRHTRFNFRHIAEHYARATPDVQRLMERSALVIIDFDQAIESGFVKMSERLAELAASEVRNAQ